MFIRTIRNDILRSKTITLTIAIFIAAAAMLVSLAAILIVNLSGAIDNLMLQAKTPHFMQMHSGELNNTALAAFAEENRLIDRYQVMDFLNVDGAQIVINGQSLGDSVQDNGFITQSDSFDYLLDLDGNIIQPAAGEVYVPICYMQDGSAKLGVTLTLNGKNLSVAGFLRDSQMNSLLSSSKRFLISAADYADIEGLGSVEYLIEFRLKDLADLRQFESDYTAANLDANGPTITYPLFKSINAISDGLMIAVILLISVLVVTIAFMCIRFTLLAKIEDDYREIGVMKAIGLRVNDIKKIYIGKYLFIAALGSLLGYVLSFFFKGMLLENIRLYMGESANASMASIFGLIGVVLVFLTILLYVNQVLNRFRKISPAEAIRFGNAGENGVSAKGFSLSRSGFLNINIFLGIKDVLSRKKIYLTMLSVLVIAAFIIIVPQNLHNTIASNDFITYMGLGNCDLRMDIQQTEDIPAKVQEISAALAQDADVQQYTALTTKTFVAILSDGTDERIKIDLGDHTVFPLSYSEGTAPQFENEIALSVLLARDLDKSVGDMLEVIINGEVETLRISGIYSDITNGGKTAKATFRDDSAPVMWATIAVDLVNPAQASRVAERYGSQFAYAKVSGIDKYIMQTFGGTMQSIQLASYAAIAIGLLTTILITLLFMNMLIVKDGYANAVMKAFGFTNQDLRRQYIARSIFVLIVGVILGTLLANTLGEILAGQVIASFGAASFKFVINPLAAYIISPLLLTAAVLAATLIGTRKAGQLNIYQHIKE